MGLSGPVTVSVVPEAVNRPATGSTACAADQGPAKAVNGSVSGGLGDKWCATDVTRTLRVDLGANRSMGTFVVRHAGAGGESQTLNTRAFRIETSLDAVTWSTAVTVTANTASVSTSTVPARSARYVRLVVTDSEQGTDSGAARIYEFEIYAGASTAPAAPLVAYSGTATGGRAQRFEVGRYDARDGNLGQVGEDAMRSAVVAPGYQAVACRTAWLSECTTLVAGRYDTMPIGYNAVASSLRVRRVG